MGRQQSRGDYSMAMEYHVVIVPLAAWESCVPRTIPELTALMRAVNRYFSFNPMKYQAAGLSESRSLLNERLPFLKHEVREICEITNGAKKEAEDIVGKLNIENVYATDFALEIVSSSPKILADWRKDWDYERLSSRLVRHLFEPELPFHSSIQGVDAASMPMPSVATCRVVLCDNVSEVERLAGELKLRKVTNALYMGNEKTTVGCNIFNFIPRKPWHKVFVLEPVVTLKPDKIEADYKTEDELGYLLALVHSLGKFYVISESIRGFCAALEWRSWFIEDLWLEYEKGLNWREKRFSYLEEDIHRIKVDLYQTIYPLVRLISSPGIQHLIASQYGVEPIPYWSEFSQLLDRGKFQAIFGKYEIQSDQIKKSVINDLRMLAAKLEEFLDRFSKSLDARLQLRSLKVGYNQLLLAITTTIIGVLAVVLGLLQLK
jgi:hypothetical protein